MRRPTRDISIRGYVTNDSERLLEVFREVAAVSAPEDGLVFDLDSISSVETQIDVDDQGICVKLTALLARSKISVQVDIGFSVELTSRAEHVEYPNILPNFDMRFHRERWKAVEEIERQEFFLGQRTSSSL